MKFFAFFFLLNLVVYGESNLKIATYNVENLFDLQKSGHEYREYIPYTQSLWNQKNYRTKLKNLARVIKNINADIIALQEVESLQALKDLRYTLKQEHLYYQYYAIANQKNTTVKVAILSKIPFLYAKEIAVTSSYKYRNILEVKFQINKQNLYLFVNHWKSKAGPESMRIVSAKALRKRIKQLGFDKNIILLGDFNSDYEEYKKFKRKRKLNDTNGHTGINDVLHTKNEQHNKESLYNLWYDTKQSERYSYIFRGKKEAMDNIIISPALLLHNAKIHYKHHSIRVFYRSYLWHGKYPYRWKVSRGRVPKHKGKGYSDHLPVIAEFVVHSNTN